MLNHTLAVQGHNHTDRYCMSSKDIGVAERGTIVNMVYGLIAVLAFTSNLVFCLAMKRSRKNLKTSHDLLIYSLAIADSLTGKKRIFVLSSRGRSSRNSTCYEQCFSIRLVLRASSNILSRGFPSK